MGGVKDICLAGIIVVIIFSCVEKKKKITFSTPHTRFFMRTAGYVR